MAIHVAYMIPAICIWLIVADAYRENGYMDPVSV